VRQLEEKEGELLRQMQRLANELAAATGAADGDGSSGGSSSSSSDEEAPSTPAQLARVLQSLTQQLAGHAAAAAQGEQRMQSLEDRIEFYEAELRRASDDANALRERVRERKRETDKLTVQLEMEREHNRNAKAIIEDLRDSRAGMAGSAGGGGLGPSSLSGLSSSDRGASFGARTHSMSLPSTAASLLATGGVAAQFDAGATPGLGGARSASRASFMAMQTPAPPGGLQRTLSRSNGSLQAATVSSPAPNPPNFSASP
jgi:hypothetical protein